MDQFIGCDAARKVVNMKKKEAAQEWEEQQLIRHRREKFLSDCFRESIAETHYVGQKSRGRQDFGCRSVLASVAVRGPPGTPRLRTLLFFRVKFDMFVSACIGAWPRNPNLLGVRS